MARAARKWCGKCKKGDHNYDERHGFLELAAKALGRGAAHVDDELVAAAMILAAVRLGTNARTLARALEVPFSRVERLRRNYVRSGVFTGDGKVAAGEWIENGCGVSFCMDVACGLGLLERA